MEAFSQWRLTHFLCVLPDLQYYRTPGADGQDALLVGVRLKLKGSSFFQRGFRLR